MLSHGQLITGQLVTYASHHTVNSSHNETTAMPCSSVSLFGFNVCIIARMISDNSYLWALKLERNETLHIHVQHGKSLQRVQSWSHQRRQSCWMWRMLGQKVRSTRYNAVRHEGQLVTPFYDVTSWPCDELTGSLRLSDPDQDSQWIWVQIHLANQMTLGVSHVSRIYFGFGFIVNPDPDPIIE